MTNKKACDGIKKEYKTDITKLTPSTPWIGSKNQLMGSKSPEYGQLMQCTCLRESAV